MRVIPIEIQGGTIAVRGDAYQWDESVRVDFVADSDIFSSSTVVHAIKGRITQRITPTYVSGSEIYADTPGWLFESAVEPAMVYAYDSGSTVAAACIRIIPRGGLPVVDETLDGLVAYRINLNMVPTGQAPLTVAVSRFDKDSRVIRARMVNGDTVYEVPSTASAMLLMTKLDGYGVEIPCTVKDGFVYVTLTEQACAAAGPAKAEIRITQSGKTIGTANFIILVEPAALDENTVISESELPLLEQAIEAAEKIEELVPVIEQAIEELEDFTPQIDLRTDEIPDTVQTYTFTDGAVTEVKHSRDGVAVRTDTFAYTDVTITEVRTLSTGESLTIVTNLSTLETTVTYAA